jgi:phage I-like protein
MPPQAQSLGTLADGRELVRMLCEVETKKGDDGKVTLPEWIHIMPAGPLVEARDGRSFQVTDLLGVAAKTELPLVIDWDHESERGKTRAGGWVEELRVQDSGDGEMPRAGIWGRTTWTPEGEADVAVRAYRFLSPVLILASESRDVQQIVSVAMTNRPALRMHGLDSFRERLSQQFGPLADAQGGEMDAKSVSAIRSAFGLKADADDAAILQAATTAANAATSLREANSLLTTQLSAAQTKVTALEGQLAERTKAEFAEKVERLLEQAGKNGKVTPADADSWRKFCLKSEDNLEMFERTILPNLAEKAGESTPPPKGQPTQTKGQYDQKRLAAYGVSAEEAAAAEKYQAERRAAADGEG